MLKQSVKTVSILAALLSLHSVASATCVGSDCAVDVNADVSFKSNYYLDKDHNGIFIQSNVGDNTAVVDLKNVVMRDNGNITGSAQAVGNNIANSQTTGFKRIDTMFQDMIPTSIGPRKNTCEPSLAAQMETPSRSES